MVQLKQLVGTLHHSPGRARRAGQHAHDKVLAVPGTDQAGVAWISGRDSVWFEPSSRLKRNWQVPHQKDNSKASLLSSRRNLPSVVSSLN